MPFPYNHAPSVVEIRGLDRMCLYPYRGTTKFRSPSLGFSLSRFIRFTTEEGFAL